MVYGILEFTDYRVTIISRLLKKRTSKLKTPPICTKVPPFERARQDDSDRIKLISTKPNPAIQNASEILKTRLFTTLSTNKGDPGNNITRYAIQPLLGAV
jgi:hypothetical protein